MNVFETLYNLQKEEITELEMERLLTFMGYTTSESIIQFLEEFEHFATIKAFDAMRQLLVLEGSLRGPAKALYQAKRADGTIIVGANDGATLVNCMAWLRQQYHTEDMRQGLRDQITALYQEINESSQAFYMKIRHLIDLAGYADAVKDQVAEIAFMNGLAKDLAIAVRSSPVALNLAQKV